MKKALPFIGTLMVFTLILAGCNLPRAAMIAPADQTATVDAAVLATVLAASDPGAVADDTVDGSDSSDADAITPSETPEDPATDTPDVPTATPSETPLPCNLAVFVKDVTVPDGKVFEPGEVFDKTWRLKNAGSCAWTSGYQIVFVGGDAMNAPASVAVTAGTVNPGQNVDVTVTLTAPASDGTYRGNWKMRDPSAVIFGVENSSSGYFWVEIEVEEPDPDPVTVTLHATSKNLSVGGMSSGARAGIAPNGDAIRAFIDFDLSGLAGLDSGSTIQSAKLDISDHDGFACFEFLHPLKAGVISFGVSPQLSDFNEVPSAILLSVPSALGISAPVTITDHVQDFVDANGADHFQFRLWLDGDDAGAGFACYIHWDDPTLKVKYIP